MRILQIGPVPPEIGGQTQGGVATHLWSLASFLNDKGHTVGVLADNVLADDASPGDVDGIQVFGLLRTSNPLLEKFLRRPSSWKKIIRTRNHFGPLRGWKGVISGLVNYQRVIEKFQPDLIHIHHLEFRFPFVHFLVEGQIPIVTTVHSTSFIDFAPTSLKSQRKDFVQRNLTLAQNLVFVSEFLKKNYEVLFPGVLNRKNAAILHNLVDGSASYPIPLESARERLSLARERSIILFVGKLIPEKGVEILIRAASHLRDREMDFRLLVVGSGPQKEELEELAHELDVVEHVSFEGPKSQSELFLYYNAADIFALPSVMESFGLVFTEAMLCGCPVLGRPDVLLEILPSERCGHHLGSSSPEIWAEEIAKMLGGPWSKDEIHGLTKKFTWQVSGEKFEKFYQELTAKG